MMTVLHSSPRHGLLLCIDMDESCISGQTEPVAKTLTDASIVTLQHRKGAGRCVRLPTPTRHSCEKACTCAVHHSAPAASKPAACSASRNACLHSGPLDA
jgi:hypothetical protein